MKQLRLVTDAKIEKQPDPRKILVEKWKEAMLTHGKRKCAMTWGELMNRLYRMFEPADEKNGEILVEYPDEEVWCEQLEGFFLNDEFAKKTNFSFNYFQKCYGQFKPKTQKRTPVNNELISALSQKMQPPDTTKETLAWWNGLPKEERERIKNEIIEKSRGFDELGLLKKEGVWINLTPFAMSQLKEYRAKK